MITVTAPYRIGGIKQGGHYRLLKAGPLARIWRCKPLNLTQSETLSISQSHLPGEKSYCSGSSPARYYRDEISAINTDLIGYYFEISTGSPPGTGRL